MARVVGELAVSGSNKAVNLADGLIDKLIAEKGENFKISFPETGYFLPLIYATLGKEIENLKGAREVINIAKTLLKKVPEGDKWDSLLGDAMDSGVATALAAELIEAIRYATGELPEKGWQGFIPDSVLRSMGIQLVDGRISGVAVIVGAAPDSTTAEKIIRELQEKNILSLLVGASDGKNFRDQLIERKVQVGLDFYVVPVGNETTSVIHAANFAIRASLSYGGNKKGELEKNLNYCKERVPAFILALGKLDDIKVAAACAAIRLGFPVITDQAVPEIKKTPFTLHEALISEKDYSKIVPAALLAREIKVKVKEIPIPVAYSAAFEGERVRRQDMYAQFGGKFSSAFEYTRSKPLNELEDGKIEVVGPEIDDMKEGEAYPLGILLEVAGRKMETDFEPILERQVHTFLNEAMGIFHMGQRNMCWIRISKDAHKKGFKIKHFGTILHARLHDTYGKIVDKAEITLYTNQKDVDRIIPEAVKSYEARDERIEGMTDESVDTFYSCTLCVPKGEMITLADGSFDNVENIIETVADKKDLEILSFRNPHMVKKPVGELFMHPAPKKIAHIKTTGNNSIKLTAKHKVLVDKREGLVWTEARALKKGDRLLSTSTTNLGDKNQNEYKPVYLVDLLPEKVKSFKSKSLPQLKKKILNEDIMYFAGLVASDGCVRHRGKQEGTSVQFTNTEKTLVDEFCRITKSLFGVPPKTRVAKPIISSSKGLTIVGRKPVFVSVIHNVLIGKLMMGLGIGYKRKKGEKVESWSGEKISRLSPKLISAFIRGLFDGDGHVTNTHILITTGTHKGAQHILLLFKKLGISTYITEIKRGYQVGTRSFGDYIRFRETISSNYPRKRKKMHKTKFSFDKNHVVRTDAVPFKCGIMLRVLLNECKKKIEITKLPVDYKSIEFWIKTKRRASKSKLKLLLNSLKDKVEKTSHLYQELLKWTETKITFEKVKSVENIAYNEKEVYNFSVPGTHNYLVNGIVVKNCQSFAPNHVCMVKPERLGLCGAYSWLDAKACYELNPTGPNQPVKKGEALDAVKGEWKGVNDFIYQKSNKTLERFHGYSLMTFPETSCCVGDTEVLIDDETVKIGDFVNKHRGGEKYAKCKALTLNSNRTVKENIVAMQKFPAPKELVKIKTKTGREITLTKDHKICVDTREGISWIPASEIKQEDRVVSLKRLEVDRKIPEMGLISEKALSEDLFYLLGLLASDGSICKQGKTEYRINFINTNKTLIEEYRKTYKRLFPNKHLGIRVKNKSNSIIRGRKVNARKICYDCYSNNFILGYLAVFFGIKAGLKGKWSLNKLVGFPKELIAQFLAGLFDGDGSVRLRKYDSKWNTGEAYICINDKNAAFHLQTILRRFGIIGYVRKSTSVYKVIVYGENLADFLKEIPIRHPGKKTIAVRILRLHKRDINKTQRGVFPFEIGPLLAGIPEAKYALSPSTLFYYKTRRSRPVLDNVNKVLAVMDEKNRVALREKIKADYFLDIVSNVKTIKKHKYNYVYNLTLSDTHSYFANGMHIANCGCFECIIAILPEANGFMVVSREYPGFTPAGMKFSTLAGSVGGGNQTPGFMGVGRLYIVSKKFISADGGLKRLVWMPKELKDALSGKLKKRCEEEGMPDLFDKIATEENATESEPLMKFLQEVKHPALTMPALM